MSYREDIKAIFDKADLYISSTTLDALAVLVKDARYEAYSEGYSDGVASGEYY